MTEDDINLDTDISAADDLGGESDAKARPSLAEIWQSNPLLKVAAAVAGVVIMAVIYLNFVAPEEKTVSKVGGGDFGGVKAAPGREQFDKEYTKAVQSQNQQRAQVAAQTGGSAMPTSIGSSKGAGLDIPQVTGDAGEADPLQEWKKNIENRRIKIKTDEDEDRNALAPQPDVVPMVQPIRPQPVAKQIDPNQAKAIEGQMRTLVQQQVPGDMKTLNITGVENEYTKKKRIDKLAEDAKNKLAGGKDGATLIPASLNGKLAQAGILGQPQPVAKNKVIVPAGQMAYAQLLTELNSDIKSPALAQIMSGPFEGGRAIGDVQKQDEFLVINFSRIIKDGVSYSINGIALDENTTLPAQASDVDHHYLQRILLPAAAKFVEGYGSAVAETGQETTTTAGGGVASSTPKPSAKESLYKGLESASGKVSSIIEEGSNREVTVHLARGTTMGILFLDTVTTASVSE